MLPREGIRAGAGAKGFARERGEQLQIPYTTQAEKELRNTLHLKNHEIELLQAKVHYLESLLKKS
ncbi:hypothetical protein [Flavobacterium sp.]|uniref:hypothetical protein n=1 Tax=Flavobacterium sp. TaxID=239 RepID=UPI00391D6B2A